MSLTAPLAYPKIEVMVCDDSAVIRGLLTRTLETDPDIKVVASVADGEMALASLKRQAVDVLVLDIEMPNMDGITALPLIIQLQPKIKIIMASTLTHRNAEISMRALSLGAADYIAKPSTPKELMAGQGFAAEFLNKVRALGQAAHRQKGLHLPAPDLPRPSQDVAVSAQPKTLFPGKSVQLRPMLKQRPEALAIASSTGGPQALLEIFAGLGQDIKQPVFITQHMPASFTKLLAEHITKLGGLPCAEAVHGEPVQGGRVYLAPGDFHMEIERRGAGLFIELNQKPPENFCRPAADPMLRSLSSVYGSKIFCAILTGMGHDGRQGAEVLVQAGGVVVAQDEASSVVWGMPGAVATAGLCSAVVPLNEMSGLLKRAAMVNL